MTPNFIFIKDYQEIINLEQIARISFTEGDDEDDDILEIQFAAPDVDDLDIEGKEAAELFAEIIKRIPNLIAI